MTTPRPRPASPRPLWEPRLHHTRRAARLDDDLVSLRRHVVQRVAAHAPGPVHRACLYLAHFTAEAVDSPRWRRLLGHRRPPILQAGSAFWRRVPAELDDGVVPTHFGYQCALDLDLPAALADVRFGRLPEMHVWVALPDVELLLDMSSGFAPLACRELLGLDWPAPPPPPFVCARRTTTPAQGRYQPTPDACVLASALAWRLYQPRYLQSLCDALQLTTPPDPPA